MTTQNLGFFFFFFRAHLNQTHPLNSAFHTLGFFYFFFICFKKPLFGARKKKLIFFFLFRKKTKEWFLSKNFLVLKPKGYRILTKEHPQNPFLKGIIFCVGGLKMFLKKMRAPPCNIFLFENGKQK